VKGDSRALVNIPLRGSSNCSPTGKTLYTHLPVVLYRSLALSGKHRLRVFENRVLRRIFEPRGGSGGRVG